MKKYDHQKIEKKWQKEWGTRKIYKTETNTKKKKFYVLDMFPYPSGAGLHVGHPRGYIGSDVYARMKRMQGFNVLHPMGYDAFGLPAEQYAIEHKIHPRKAVEKNVATFEKQLSVIGLSYDWSRKVNTTDPAYYKWTQWIFLEIYNSWYDKTKDTARPIPELVTLFEKSGNTKINAVCDSNYATVFSGSEWKKYSPKEKEDILMKYRLAYEGFALVNWCPKLGTVLANDEIVEDKNGAMVSERGGYPVEKISMRQWFMRITAYADRLLSDIEPLGWSSHIKEIQKNWIGKSEGSEIEFKIIPQNNTQKILIGTRNEAKFRMTKECLPVIPGVEFVSLNDIAPVDDSSLVEGMDYVENAKMKAEFYYKKTGLPTISLDNVFWLEKWNKDNGIMIHMRKEANPKSGRATDEETVSFLKSWVKKVGGKSKAHFIYAVAFASSSGTDGFVSTQREYILQEKQSENFWPGYPTESLLIDVKTKEYKGDQDNSARYKSLIKDFSTYAPKWFSKNHSVKVFTTRADTLFGVTYIVLAPEHALVDTLKQQIANWTEVEKYREFLSKESNEERMNDQKEKTGIELQGITAVNPANGEEVPVWVADYVLAGYGTGAVMAVPAHDERDFEFAKKYKLPIRNVIAPLFKTTTGVDALHADLPLTKRDTIIAIVKHWSEEKYICLLWKTQNWKTFVIGGTDGEDPAIAGAREIQEETGYQNIKFIRTLGNAHAQFYAPHKNQNRWANAVGAYFQLIDGEKKEIEDAEKNLHEVVWMNRNEIEEVVCKEEAVIFWREAMGESKAITHEGILINSREFNDLPSEEARIAITKKVNGKIVTKYKMRDAIFARQRYWGEPIPLRHNKNDGTISMLKTKDLPLELPNVTSYEPTGTGESPLAGVKSWVKEGYETNTMPGWAGSSWYFLRYMDPKNSKEFASKKALKYWKDVDMYVGGQEHATGHLLYSRFWHKFLYDRGYVPTKEPFKTLKNQGLIIATDGRKMSKRWGNVINPDEIVKTYGADTLRVYEMFMGPFEQTVSWSTESIIGSRRFIERVYRLHEKVVKKYTTKETPEKVLNQTIKKVTEDIETMNFNTAISSMMMFLNEMDKIAEISIDDFKSFLQILSPFAPHITEELWNSAGEKKTIHHSTWPKWNPKKMIEDTITIAVQVNGKVRTEVSISVDMKQESIEQLVLSNTIVKEWIKGGVVKRIIYVPKRLINIVV